MSLLVADLTIAPTEGQIQTRVWWSYAQDTQAL
jgi:hypothetical protein